VAWSGFVSRSNPIDKGTGCLRLTVASSKVDILAAYQISEPPVGISYLIRGSRSVRTPCQFADSPRTQERSSLEMSGKRNSFCSKMALVLRWVLAQDSVASRTLQGVAIQLGFACRANPDSLMAGPSLGGTESLL
jgi:hypothetical protein